MTHRIGRPGITGERERLAATSAEIDVAPAATRLIEG
jgi:hypothetical protein